MKVYLAAPWRQQARARRVAEFFESAGMEITSSWLSHAPGGDSAGTGVPVRELQEQAHRDISDILRSDYMIVLNYEKSEGKAVETGIALQAGITVVSVGPRSNIFQTLTHQVADADEALAYVKGHTPSGRR